MIFDFDDFGSDHVISDMCRARDCRKELDILHTINPAFKVTLFAIPGEMTQELLNWCKANRSWVELGVHGFYHTSNYECEKMTYDEFDAHMEELGGIMNGYFVKLFKAPGWQISDDAMEWLKDHNWMIADQGYNDNRRPSMDAYINYNGNFVAAPRVGNPVDVEAWHGHTWNCVGNGIEETLEQLKEMVVGKEFNFVTEVLR